MKNRILLFCLIIASLPFMTGCAAMNDPAVWAAMAQARQNNPQPDYSQPQVTPNAYGLGVNADQYGRPSTYQLQNGQQLDPIFNQGVKQNVYGPGVGQDQFGRPVYNSPP
jgi:hypothetical protein